MAQVYGYLFVPGIAGSKKGGSMEVIAVSHEVTAVYDEVTGQPQPGCRYRSLVVTKPLYLATPKLNQAMASKNVIAGVTKLEFWRDPPSGGPPENHYTVTVTDVQVASIRTILRDRRRSDELA